MKMTNAEPLPTNRLPVQVRKRRAACNPLNTLRFLKLFNECLDRLNKGDPQDIILTESNLTFLTLQNRLNEALYYLCNFDIREFPTSYTNSDFNKLRAHIRFMREGELSSFPIKIRVHFRLPQEDQVFISSDWQKQILDFINSPFLDLQEVQLCKTTEVEKNWIRETLKNKNILYYYNKKKLLLIREAIETTPEENKEQHDHQSTTSV